MSPIAGITAGPNGLDDFDFGIDDFEKIRLSGR